MIIPINEILAMIEFKEETPKTKDELIKTICALDSSYYKQSQGLFNMNKYTLTHLIYTILEIKYPPKYAYKNIVFTEDMIYY